MMANYKRVNKPDDGKGKPESQKNYTEEEKEIIDIDLNPLYHQYQECMSTTGLDLRMKRLESLLMESDLFAKGLRPLEKQSQILKVGIFLMDLNWIYFTPSNTDGAETPFVVTTLSDLIGNTVLGGLINWDSLLESLHGMRLEESQEIIVENLEKLSRIFSYFKEQWNDKNLENVLLILAGEKLFKKGENREYKKNFCFKMAKKYLPLDMQLLFTKSFSEEDLTVLVSEIYNLGSAVPIVIAEPLGVYYLLSTQVEFINKKTLELNMKLQNSELALSGEFLDDLYLLQTRYRKDMYNMSGKELEDSESCRLLPREVQIPCNLHTERMLVPLEQLVPPNFLFRKDMPNYLRLAGVTYYMTKMIALQIGTDEINLKSYNENNCLIENIPTFFEERNSKLRIRYKADVTEEMKSETLLEFQAFNVAWRVFKYLIPPKSDVKLNETEESCH
ncbi:hypothetical protein Anas_06568 [Armadillidium nasatum]|uniref:Uncharacterized protein n=1 Tax=Armadillidium nasatum TaxID=96803 RepID=A0A5N5SXX6_9CRUS|nr:hypothetical protein Anas_06568 [Armadillidium nasatum]